MRKTVSKFQWHILTFFTSGSYLMNTAKAIAGKNTGNPLQNFLSYLHERQVCGFGADSGT